MITHIALFQLQPGAKADRDSVTERLAAELAEIPGAISIQVAADVRGTARSYDLGALMYFPDFQTLESFIQHPLHVALGSWLGPLVASSAVLDYETPPPPAP